MHKKIKRHDIYNSEFIVKKFLRRNKRLKIDDQSQISTEQECLNKKK